MGKPGEYAAAQCARCCQMVWSPLKDKRVACSCGAVTVTGGDVNPAVGYASAAEVKRTGTYNPAMDRWAWRRGTI